MTSFSSELKSTLMGLTVKKKCCHQTFSAVLALDKTSSEDQNRAILAIRERCRCPFCLPHLLRGLFVTYGSMTDPEKQYHLDFSFRHEGERDVVAALLAEAELEPKRSHRGEKFLVYFKGTSSIEDFLVYIGAPSVAFDLMNRKIVRELRNNSNRLVNCDTANIKKVLQASKKYLDAIDFLIDTGEIDHMPQALRETALMKRANPQIPLETLGGMMNPSVSKSGIKHRLEKIYEYYTEKNEP